MNRAARNVSKFDSSGSCPRRIAAHLVHARVKRFSESQHEEALRRLKEGTPLSR